MPLLVIAGYGPGISHATAGRFGREGYTVALIGRTVERLERGGAQLRSLGIEASGHPSDASDAQRLITTLDEIRATRGPVSAVPWTAFRSGGVRDVLAAPLESVSRVFDVGVLGLLAVAQHTRGDLAASSGSFLVVNGAVGERNPRADRISTMLDIDGTALENAAKSKLVGLLAERLRPDGVYVGQITINGSVGGTVTASPTAIDPNDVADRLWSMTRSRDMTRVMVSEDGWSVPS